MTCLFSSVVVSSHFCHGPEPTVTLGRVIEKEVASWSHYRWRMLSWSKGRFMAVQRLRFRAAFLLAHWCLLTPSSLLLVISDQYL